jgi:hypothetical protein
MFGRLLIGKVAVVELQNDIMAYLPLSVIVLKE